MWEPIQTLASLAQSTWLLCGLSVSHRSRWEGREQYTNNESGASHSKSQMSWHSCACHYFFVSSRDAKFVECLKEACDMFLLVAWAFSLHIYANKLCWIEVSKCSWGISLLNICLARNKEKKSLLQCTSSLSPWIFFSMLLLPMLIMLGHDTAWIATFLISSLFFTPTF
jgi:hypothetical protein